MKTPALLSLLGLIPSAAFAAHGVGLGQPPKYPANFTAFEYVNPNAPKGGTFTTPFLGAFDTLNPFTLKGNHEYGISMLTLDTLTEQSMDEPYAVYGLIAEDIALAPDGLSVTFKINPKAKFHNGDPVLAKDVAASFNILTKDKAAAPHVPLLLERRGQSRNAQRPHRRVPLQATQLRIAHDSRQPARLLA